MCNSHRNLKYLFDCSVKVPEKKPACRLELMRAGKTPTLVQPNQIPMYSGLFSMNRATQSPRLKPRSTKKLAMRFE